MKVYHPVFGYLEVDDEEPEPTPKLLRAEQLKTQAMLVKVYEKNQSVWKKVDENRVAILALWALFVAGVGVLVAHA